MSQAAVHSPAKVMGTDGAFGPCMSNALRERVRAILLAEFKYWNNTAESEDETMSAIRIGATGAVSNVLAALCGHPCPWHPKETQ